MSFDRRADAPHFGRTLYAEPEEAPSAVHPQVTREKDDGGRIDRELPAPVLADPPPSDPINAFTPDEDSSMVPVYPGDPASTTPNVSADTAVSFDTQVAA